MGQGNTTGLASLVADELDADWALVRTEYAPSDAKLYKNLAFGMQGTGGSSAIANSFLQYRSAGATARAMLVAAAADAWKVPASEIRTSKSMLTHASGRRATYGEMATAASRQTPPENPPLKNAGAVHLHRQGPLDAASRFAVEVQRHGDLHHRRQAAGPAHRGDCVAAVASAPSSSPSMPPTRRSVKGVTDVVEVPEGVAVVATGTWAALQGRRALKVQWDESASKDLDSEALLARYRAQAAQPGTPFAKPADVRRRLRRVKTIEAVYEFPFLAHATMEPMNCVAWLHDGMLETWSGHQFPTFDHMLAAKAAGLPMDKVKLHTLVSGGSFGRRANVFSDFTVAAVNVAKAIGGRAPVRVQFSREDDTGAGLYRPMYVHAVKAGLDAQGRVAAGSTPSSASRSWPAARWR